MWLDDQAAEARALSPAELWQTDGPNPVTAHAIAHVEFDDGTCAELIPMTFGKVRLYHTRGYDVLGAWCYDSPLAGLAGLAIWDGTGLPVGWFKDTFTGEVVPANTRQDLERVEPSNGA